MSRMKKSIMLSAISILFSVMVLFPFARPVHAAAPKLSASKITVTVKNNKKIEIKGSRLLSCKASVSDKKIAKITASAKNSLTIRGLKVGTCRLKVVVRYRKASSKKIYKKVLSGKIQVKKASEESDSVPGQPGGSEQPGASDQPGQSDPQDFAVQLVKGSLEEKYMTFAFRLFKETALEAAGHGENVLISPESILSAMMMVTNGAGKDTYAQLKEAITGSDDYDQFQKNFSSFQQSLNASKMVDFHEANSIWIRDDKGIHVDEDFIQMNKTYYGAESYKEAFDRSTVAKMNQWVNKNTNGMIPSIVDQLSQDDVMILLNALAFEGQWAVPYEKYNVKEDGIYTNASGKKESAVMLDETIYKYLEDDICLGFTKSYKGNEYAFLAMLPKEGISMTSFVKQLSPERYYSFYHNKKMDTKVFTRIPEFSYAYKTSLKKSLEAIGIKDAFDAGKADFSRMIHMDNGANVYVSDVLHKTYIELDRLGTKAAAVTEVVMKEGSLPMPQPALEIYLDRPFCYAIVHVKTGIPVFVGMVNTVAK